MNVLLSALQLASIVSFYASYHDAPTDRSDEAEKILRVIKHEQHWMWHIMWEQRRLQINKPISVISSDISRMISAFHVLRDEFWWVGKAGRFSSSVLLWLLLVRVPSATSSNEHKPRPEGWKELNSSRYCYCIIECCSQEMSTVAITHFDINLGPDVYTHNCAIHPRRVRRSKFH